MGKFLIILDTLPAMNFKDATQLEEKVTMILASDPSLEKTADYWRSMRTPGFAVEFWLERYDSSLMSYMQEITDEMRQGRSFRMSDLRWRSIPLPILRFDAESRNYWSALVARYGRPDDAAWRDGLYYKQLNKQLARWGRPLEAPKSSAIEIDEEILEGRNFNVLSNFKDPPHYLKILDLQELSLDNTARLM